MNQIYHVTTEGDGEGRTTRHLGYCTGNQNDIMAYFGPDKVYAIRLEPVNVMHISNDDAKNRLELISKKKSLEQELHNLEERINKFK